jgi:C4-dicarboxylate-specific signal transduction histidine kinase
MASRRAVPDDGTRGPTRRRAGWFGLVLGALLPLVTLSVFAATEVIRVYREADELRLHDSAAAVAAALDARLAAYETAMTVLSLTPGIGDEQEIGPLLRRATAAAEALGGWIAVLGPPPAFAPLASTLVPLPTGPTAYLPEVHAPLQRAFDKLEAGARAALTDLFRAPLSDREAIALLAPLRGNGWPNGALAFAFGPDRLREALGWENRPSGHYAAVIDGSGRIVAHTRGAHGVAPGTPAPPQILREFEGRQRGITSGTSALGQRTTFAFERLRTEPSWIAIVAETRSFKAASTTRLVAWVLAAIGAVLLAFGLLVWMRRTDVVQAARQEAEALRTGRAEVERLHGGLPAVLFLREMAPNGTSRLVYRAGDIDQVTGWLDGTAARSMTWAPLLAPGTHFQVFLARVMAEGAGTLEWRMRQPDGSLRAMRTHARRLSRQPDGSGEIVGYVLNVDAEVKAAARAASAGRLSALGEMAAGLAHEVKQPLQSVSLLAETAQIAAGRGDMARLHRNLDGIVEQTVRAADIIENLRRFARGAPEGAQAERVALDEAVRRTLMLGAASLKDKDVTVEVALGTPAPAVLAHPIGLQQVLLNLVLNACDAMAARPAGEPRRIRFALAASPADQPPGQVRLLVEDTGGGIHPDVLERLFQPFVTTKAPEKGTGLGLSISHGLIKAMGGDIEAWNGKEGAVFAITLPATPPAGEPSA